MSNKLTNNKIYNFIIKNFKKNNSLENNEIELLFKNLTNNKCSFPYNKIQIYNIIGTDNNTNNIVDYLYLIPNLYRECFVQESISIPSACPIFIYSSNVTYYVPYIIDINIIKSFLYFGFPSSVRKHTPDSIENHINSNNIKNKIAHFINSKRNTTYGSYTPAINYFSQLYSREGLFVELIELYNYSTYAYNANSKSTIIAPYTIPWNYTTGCTSVTGQIDKTNIVGNNQSVLTPTELTTIYSIFSNAIYLNNIKNKNTTDGIIANNSIFNILNIAYEVYQDVLLQIQYFIENKTYCEKSYMSIANIPLLIKLWKNYYNNQVYAESQSNVSYF